MKDEQSSIVPFGKYKDQPVELMLADADYLQWVTGQPGLMTMLQKRYPTVFNIITVGAPATEDTPEHNKLQARFLEQDFQYAFLELRLGKSVFVIASELANKVNEEVSDHTKAAIALATQDCVNSKALLQEAEKENAKTAKEDPHLCYQEERQKHEKEGQNEIAKRRENPFYGDPHWRPQKFPEYADLAR